MDRLTLTTSTLALEFDAGSGAIVSIRNLARGLQLIAEPPAAPPFRVHFKEAGVIQTHQRFRWDQRQDGLRLTWVLRDGLWLTSEVVVRGDDILFTLATTAADPDSIDSVDYPILAGIGRLGGRGQDELAHTHATGMLFHDPVDLLDADSGNERRLRRSPYPAGFAGSTMQFLAYYARGRGGFLIATEDPAHSFKWFSISKDDRTLVASVTHKAAQPQAGAALVPPYAVVLAPLTRGTWYEAADRYRIWAFGQPWAQPGARSAWLRERVGVSTFGINARHDRSAWLDQLHRLAGTPVFHVLGPNWARRGQDYEDCLPRGRADWFFPARFSEANLATIRRNGDFWAPFEFDLLCVDDPGASEPVLESRLVPDATNLGLSDPGLLKFPLMCAGTGYWRDFHVERDARLAADYAPDAVYYDISVNNLLLECHATSHRHQPGAGAAVAKAFQAMYSSTNTAMAAAAGRHVPAGTEMMSEIFLGQFDYYQARGEAGPYASFETAPFRDWIIAGAAEKIPLFTYVYGSRAPVRMDGWAKLSAESGDLFYWTAAQVLLNGGLFELNYEFSALEDIAGRCDDPAEHYYTFDERHYAVDPAKAAFVAEVARTRTGPANPFLARGAMLPAPGVDAPTVDLSYNAYNLAKHDPLYGTSGVMTVPSVLASCWQLDGRAIWLVANVLPKHQEVRVDGARVALPARRITLVEP